MPVISENTAPVTARCFFTIVLLLTIFQLTACISVPDDVVSRMSPSGAVAVQHHSFGPFSIIETYSIIPGTKPVSHRPSGRVGCEANFAELEVSWAGDSLSKEEASEVCHLGARSLSHVAGYAKVLQGKVSFRLRFFPYGSSVRIRDYSVVGTRRINPLFAKPIGLTRRDAERAALVTLPHEAVHIAADLGRFGWSQEEEEKVAYIAGYCSAWATAGDIDDDWLLVGRFSQTKGVPTSATRSSNLGYAVAGEIRAILRGAESRGTELDVAMNDYCDRNLRPLLDGQMRSMSGPPPE